MYVCLWAGFWYQTYDTANLSIIDNFFTCKFEHYLEWKLWILGKQLYDLRAFPGLVQSAPSWFPLMLCHYNHDIGGGTSVSVGLGRKADVNGSSPDAEGFLVAEEMPGHLLSTAQVSLSNVPNCKVPISGLQLEVVTSRGGSYFYHMQWGSSTVPMTPKGIEP